MNGEPDERKKREGIKLRTGGKIIWTSDSDDNDRENSLNSSK
jgi:hypothetical protein